jgi:Raf kinase inhibitor-like YbhB/YbcL family protein
MMGRRSGGPGPAATSALGLWLSLCGCGGDTPVTPEVPDRLTIRLNSPAFSDGGSIPRIHTCDGGDRSPPLEWSGVPATARSLALVVDDPDAPGGTWSHWVVFGLSTDVHALAEGVSATDTISTDGGASARQGVNDFGKVGYGGPCPPGGTHRYFFRLYALDRELDLPRGATRADVLRAIEGHIVAEGRLVGRYARSP